MYDTYIFYHPFQSLGLPEPVVVGLFRNSQWIYLLSTCPVFPWTSMNLRLHHPLERSLLGLECSVWKAILFPVLLYIFRGVGTRKAHTIQGVVELWIYKGRVTFSALFIILVLTMSNIWFAFFNNYQALSWSFHGTICHNFKILLLSGNGQLKVHHFLCGEDCFSPHAFKFFFVFIYIDFHLSF